MEELEKNNTKKELEFKIRNIIKKVAGDLFTKNDISFFVFISDYHYMIPLKDRINTRWE